MGSIRNFLTRFFDETPKPTPEALIKADIDSGNLLLKGLAYLLVDGYWEINLEKLSTFNPFLFDKITEHEMSPNLIYLWELFGLIEIAPQLPLMMIPTVRDEILLDPLEILFGVGQNEREKSFGT